MKWLLLRNPSELSARDSRYCQALYHLRPSLEEAACLARRFVTMVRERKSDQLDDWLEQASASPLQELHRFALGLRAEYGAMRAALREPWSTGQVARADYQTQVSQTADVRAGKNRSATAACVACGLTIARESKPDGGSLSSMMPQGSSLASWVMKKEEPMEQRVFVRT